MAETMTFTLRGRDELSRVLNNAGDSADRLEERLDSVGSAAASSTPALGVMGKALAAIGISAAVTTLPAISALGPMIVGAGAAAGVAKLAFGGMGDAIAAAGGDSKEYKKELKKLGPEQRKFVGSIADLKKEFKGFGKEIRKIVLPAFTDALKDAGPAIDVVKDGMKGMAGVFADFGKEFGDMFANGKFRRALKKNFDLGNQFFGTILSSLDDFTLAFLEFGAKSQPVIDSFSNGIARLLDTGLPGFFDGLSTGIGGTAKMFDGLFDAINGVLPALGRFIGAFSKAIGPVLGDLFRTGGKQMSGFFDALAGGLKYATPVFREIAASIRVFTDVMAAAFSIGKKVAGVLVNSLWPSFDGVKDAVGPMQKLADWFDKNEVAVNNFVIAAANGIIDFVATVIRNIPNAIHSFGTLATSVLNALDIIISGAAKAFGWIPGIGDQLKQASAGFDKFKVGVVKSLKTAESASRDFAAKVVPRLERNKLKMNISDWQSKIRTAEKQLKNAKGEKKAKLTANITDWTKKIGVAELQLKTTKDTKRAKLTANIKNWTSQLDLAERAIRTLPASKRAHLRGEISDLKRKVAAARRDLASVHDKTVTLTISRRNLYTGKIGRMKAAHGGLVPGYASGGSVQALQAGGYVRGPGTTTSDSILGMFSGGTARVADREYVIQAQAVRKYGVGMFDALNEMRVQPARPMASATGASGGATTHNTWNVYPQQVSFTAHDLEALQQRADIRARVGRAR